MNHRALQILRFIFLVTIVWSLSAEAQSPGGISTGLQLWLKANVGTTTVGVNVTGWQDQSPAPIAVSVFGSPDLIPVGYNYNPYINWTMSGATGGDYLHIPTHTFQSFFWVSQLSNLSRPSTHLATYDGVTLGQPCNGCPIHGGANGGVVAQYHELGYGNGTFQAAGVWRKNGTATGISYNTPHSGKFDIITALGGSAVSTNVFMGGQNNNAPVFDGRARDWLGPVGEIIAYSGAITAVQANKVESYLGIKYGITLGGNGSATLFYTSPNGTTIWAAGTGFHNDVAGIGNDMILEALNQPKSHSINTPADAVIMANGNFAAPVSLADGEYLVWGHNNGPFTSTCQNFSHGGPVTPINATWGRVWRTQKTGTPSGNVVIAIDMTMFQGPSGLGTANNADVKLMVDDNNSFADGSAGEHTYVPTAGYSATGGQIYFSVPYADIQNGVGYFKLGFVVSPPTLTLTCPTTTICAGTSVTFTATPTNGGSAPSYVFVVNGVVVSSGSPTYTTTTLANGDQVTAVLTSNAPCVVPNSAISNTIVMTVTPAALPAVTTVASSTTICAGSPITFTASPTNGGLTPGYQWYIGGVAVPGANSVTFTTSTLANNDNVTVEMTTSASCVSPLTAVSSGISITVNPVLVPQVTIVASSTTICANTSVTFTATPTNGGTPSYQWYVNGVASGTNSDIFTTSTLTNNDSVTVVLTSNATCVSPATDTSSAIYITVNAMPVPLVTISSTDTTICAGTSVTFTASPTNGGTIPAYQWQVNGTNVGTNSNQYTSSTLANGEVVTVTLTSNANCVSPATVTSTGITMIVNPILIPSVSIVATTTTICAGASVTYTATPTNGGASPTYQWLVNSTAVGTNSNTFTTSALVNNDTVTAILTSNATCVAPSIDTSAAIVMTVNPILVPSVTTVASLTTICAGTSVLFTVSPTNGGASPIYQWQVNGVNVGINSATYSSTTLANNDSVTVIMTSNATCVAPANDTSTYILMTVNPLQVPTITISSTDTTICAGTSVTFTAVATNGGAAPSYQWQVNGANAGTNSTTYTSSTFANNNSVTVVLTSNALCASPTSLSATPIVMTVNPILVPSVTIAASATTICAGTNVTFTATPVNGGPSPSYQWIVNGLYTGPNSSTYNASTFISNDVVSVVLSSNATCVSPAIDTSNTITLTVNPIVIPSVSIAANATTICAGTRVTFTATPINGGTTPNYQWQVNGANQGSNLPIFITSGLSNSDVVTVIMTSNAPCATPATIAAPSITMNVTPMPVAAFTYNTDNVNELNPSVAFNNLSQNATNWLWNFGIGSTSTVENPSYSFPSAGTYTVILVANNGVCSDTVSELVDIATISTYFIPNAFSPNDDGINDVFMIKGTGISKNNFDMRIFDRWGELIFESTDLTIGWNGWSHSDWMAQEDVYVYVISFALNNDPGNVMKRKGKITLIR